MMKMNTEILHQTLAFIPVCLIELAVGMGLGWMPPILNQLKNANFGFSLTEEECSWMPTLHYIARGIGPIFTAIFIDRVGRNSLIMFIAYVNFLTWIIIYATRSVNWLYVVRVLFGVAISVEDISMSIYIGENCSPKIRGTFTAVANLFFYGGMLIAFILATYLSYENVALVHGTLGFLTLLSTVLLKEPAQFLLMKGKVEEAKKHYYWLRGSGDDVILEFEETRREISEEKSKTTFSEHYRSLAVRKSFRIIVITMFLMMATGFSAISSFITITFTTSDPGAANKLTILYGLIQLISCCVSSCIIDKFNRRALFLLTCIIIVISQLGTILLYSIKSQWQIPYFSWFLFVTSTTYLSTFAMLMFPLTATIRGELLPQNVKALGNCAGTIASSVSAFIATKVFLSVANHYGYEMNFALFCIMTLILLTYIHLELPETRGKSLIKIQRELEER